MLMTHAKDFRLDTVAPVLPSRPAGLFPGTKVETASGWRDVTTLAPGALLYTFDGGLRPVRELRFAHGAADAIRVPAGVLGNDDEIFLAADQLVMIDTGRAYDWLGSPVALVRPEDLVGLAGIRRRAAPTRELIMPVFAEEEVVYAATGLRAHAPTAAGAEHFMVLTRDEAVEILTPAA